MFLLQRVSEVFNVGIVVVVVVVVVGNDILFFLSLFLSPLSLLDVPFKIERRKKLTAACRKSLEKRKEKNELISNNTA
jgi:hypothetical protein